MGFIPTAFVNTLGCTTKKPKLQIEGLELSILNYVLIRIDVINLISKNINSIKNNINPFTNHKVISLTANLDIIIF